MTVRQAIFGRLFEHSGLRDVYPSGTSWQEQFEYVVRCNYVTAHWPLSPSPEPLSDRRRYLLLYYTTVWVVLLVCAAGMEVTAVPSASEQFYGQNGTVSSRRCAELNNFKTFVTWELHVPAIDSGTMIIDECLEQLFQFPSDYTHPYFFCSHF